MFRVGALPEAPAKRWTVLAYEGGMKVREEYHRHGGDAYRYARNLSTAAGIEVYVMDPSGGIVRLVPAGWERVGF